MAAVRTRRSGRSGRSVRSSRRIVAVAIGCVAIAGVVAVAFGWSAMRQSNDNVGAVELASEQSSSIETTQPAVTAHVAAAMVEVPEVIGMRLSEAKVLLGAAGLNAVLAAGETSGTSQDAKVTAQDPARGERVEGDSDVILVLAKPKPAAKTSASPAKAASPKWVVCIDPGHQARGDSAQEPIGPGATETKARVTGGATGIETGIPEYELVLQISTNLKQRLESKGVKVVMTRSTNDVNLSNRERAKIAEKANADLFVRIHCDGSTDEAMSGASTLYPTSNRWTSEFAAESKRAATRVHKALISTTDAVDRGTKARSDLSGFNWSDGPVLLVECGFLSNPVEDRLLASPHYQDKVAQGIATGVIKHLEAEQ